MSAWQAVYEFSLSLKAYWRLYTLISMHTWNILSRLSNQLINFKSNNGLLYWYDAIVNKGDFWVNWAGSNLESRYIPSRAVSIPQITVSRDHRAYIGLRTGSGTHWKLVYGLEFGNFKMPRYRLNVKFYKMMSCYAIVLMTYHWMSVTTMPCPVPLLQIPHTTLYKYTPLCEQRRPHM